MTQTQDLDHLWRFPLRRGNSNTPTEGACLLDAVSYFEYGHLDDHPPCTCPVQAAYGRVLNDFLDDDRRQILRSYVARLVGTVDHPSEILRAEYAVKRTIREVLPIVLDEYQFYDHVRHCVELSSNATMEECRIVAKAASAQVRIRQSTVPHVGVTPHVYITHDDPTAAVYAAQSASTAYYAAQSVTSASAAYYAARSASSAYYASRSTAHINSIYDVAFSIFDGMLRIGRQAESIPPTRVKMVNDSFADCAALSHQR